MFYICKGPGEEVGKSLVEDDYLEYSKEMIKKANAKRCEDVTSGRYCCC